MSETGENLIRQCEEVEALRSIYGDELQFDGRSNSFSITLTAGSLSIELFITLPEDYPGQSPPFFQVLAPALKRPEMVEITSVLQELYLENVGETVIFQWIEKAREWLQDKCSVLIDGESNAVVQNNALTCSTDDQESPKAAQFTPVSKMVQSQSESSESLDIVHGDPVSFKKSTFQGHVVIVKNVEQVRAALLELKKNKKIANATHNMFAYRIYKEDTKCYSQDCDDDGEAQAGGRLMHLLQIMDVQNVLVVVTRWYGGVHLGPDRFRLINNTARQVIEKAGLLQSSQEKKKKGM